MSSPSECIYRYPGNPVLSAEEIPYPATQIFNAGVTKYEGKYVMAFRNDVRARPGSPKTERVNIGVAYSDDGIT